MRRTLVALHGVALAVALGVTAAAWAEDPPELAIVIEKNRFQPEQVRVKAGAPFVLAVTNKDGAPEEFESRELRIEKIVPAGKTVRIRVPALKAGRYPFFGEFHEKTAQGVIVAE